MGGWERDWHCQGTKKLLFHLGQGKDLNLGDVLGQIR